MTTEEGHPHCHRLCLESENAGWYTVPGPEMRHEQHPTMRVLPAGARLRVVVFDPDRRRLVDADRLAHNLADAYELGLGLILRLRMEHDVHVEIVARNRDRRRGFTRDRESDRDVVGEVRRRLDDPARVVHALGLGRGARRQAGGGLSVPCPWHDEKTPSCSITRGPDGTVRAHCFGCGATGDVLSLVAAVNGLDSRREFRRVLERAAEIAGVTLPPGRAA